MSHPSEAEVAEQLRDALDGPSPLLAQSGVNDDGSPLAVSDPDTGELIPAVFDEDTGRVVAAIDYAQRKLALPQLERLVNYSAEKPRFAIELKDGRRLHVGGTSELRKPEVIADLIADATDRYPPAFSAAKFRPVATALRLIAELEDHGASPSDETRAWLGSYTKERLVTARDLEDDDDRRKATANGQTFTTGGRIYIYLPDFLSYVRTMRLAQITLPDLSERIQTIGFTEAKITAPRTEGKQPQRRYWQSPDGYDWSAGE
jgi:hypothetical protein